MQERKCTILITTKEKHDKSARHLTPDIREYNINPKIPPRTQKNIANKNLQ